MRVVVAGLGAMGGAVAWQLARAGVEVIGIDPWQPPHTRGSSHGESRIIREAYFEDPAYVPLVRRAAELWRELAELSGRLLLRRSGALMIGPGGSALIAGSLRSAAQHGIPVERLDRSQAGRRFPALRLPEELEVLLEPGAGVLDPEGCVEAHLKLARAAGAELRIGSGLRGWKDVGAAVEVELEDGSAVGADALVLTAGTSTVRLLPELGLQVERQVMLWFAPNPEAGAPYAADDPVFLWETEAGELFYGIPGADRLLKAARHHGGATEPPESLQEEVTVEDERMVRSFLARYFPGAAGSLRRSVVCRYTNAPGGRFVIDLLPGAPAVHVVSACSGHGFKFASAIGEAVARRILGERELLDLSFFAVSSPPA